MRKLIWCCSAAAVLAVGGFLSLSYHACRSPESLVGRFMQIIAEASVAMRPLGGLTALAARTSQAKNEETPGLIEAGIPDDPHPIEPEPAREAAEAKTQLEPTNDKDWEAAPIVIHEDDPLPLEQISPVAGGAFEMSEVRPQMPPRMPYADEIENKPAEAEAKTTGDANEEAEDSAFKEWMKLFTEGKEDKSSTVEELPPPIEDEAQAEGKCQEDSHLHEHYSGCPRMTCPYSGATKRKGKEESSEEPPQTGKKPHSHKESKSEDKPLRTQGVDTMEYRPSDGGLNEYGPGPLH